jgi:uracil-DNA glycosylase
LNFNIDKDWQDYLKDEFSKEYFITLLEKIKELYKNKEIYPKEQNLFRAFNFSKPKDIKVVIIGQDPYHGVNQANGLAFSVYDECKIPPSLRNIYKELVDDIGCDYPKNGDLSKWAENGVLLINNVFSVEASKPNSHKGFGWEIFSDNVIKKLSNDFEHIVFILWGASSQKKESLIDTKKHLIIKSAHPSPLSAYRGFFGSKPFSKINNYLKYNNIDEIEWCLDG